MIKIQKYLSNPKKSGKLCSLLLFIYDIIEDSRVEESIYKYLENNFTKEITHHSADVGKNIYEVRFYLDETKKHIFLHCYHDEDGWRDFNYFVGGLLRFVKESEENKEKATEMFRYFDCVESE